MSGDERRSFRAGREGRTPPLFDKGFDRNSYNQGRTVRAWSTSSKNTESSGAPGCLAILAFIGIIAFFWLIKEADDAGKKKAQDAQDANIIKAEDAQYANITAVPVKVSNRFAKLLAEPSFVSGFAACVGTCPGDLGTADSIAQQGAARGWVRLIARYPQGYIKGWLPAGELQTDQRKLVSPHPRSQPPPQVVSPPPDISNETGPPPMPQQEVPHPFSGPTSDIAPDKPPPPIAWPAEGILVSARHIGRNGCDGQLTLRIDALEFVCPADQTRLTVPIADVKRVDHNGIETREDHKYHFSIPQYSKDRTAALFVQWRQASRSGENQPAK